MIKLDKGSCQYLFLSPKGVLMRREEKIKRVQKKRLKRSVKKRATTRKMKNRAKRLEQSSGEQSSRCASSPIPSLHKQSARRDQAIHGGRKSSLLPLKLSSSLKKGSAQSRKCQPKVPWSASSITIRLSACLMRGQGNRINLIEKIKL